MALKFFISYSHVDERFRKGFEITLSLLERQKLIELWSDREILPGALFENEISTNLENADVIIPLLSRDFIASTYCYNIEMLRAFEKHDNRSAVIVPIIIRPCTWKNSPFANFQVLPSEGKPISTWQNRDKAWLSVSDAIFNLCNSLLYPGNITVPLATFTQGKNKQVTSTSFKIGIFGDTQSGKSTLCNALIGSEIMRVSDITPVTRLPQRALMNYKGSNITIVDCPGIGESIEEDQKIEKIYLELFEEVDLIIWVLRADVRNYSSDQKFIEKIKQIESVERRYLIVLNMIDRIILENHGWDYHINKPNKSLDILIDRKIMYVSGIFRIPSTKIIPTVGFLKYNIESLFDEIDKIVIDKF